MHDPRRRDGRPNFDEADGGLDFRRAKNRKGGDAEAQVMAKHVRPVR